MSNRARLDALAAAWVAEGEKRRRMSPHDVTADVLDFCAAELRTTVEQANEDDEELSVIEYAALVNRVPSTVRRWCQTGAIASRPVGREYRIRRGEPAPNLLSTKIA